MVYSGDKVNNFNTAIVIVFVLITICVAFYFGTGRLLGFILVSPYVCWVTVTGAFYFELTYHELIVHNYLVPGMKFRYRLSEITCVDIAAAGKRTTSLACIKIIRSGKTSIGFKSAGMKLKDWYGLINDLQRTGIDVKVAPDVLMQPESL